MLPWSVLETSRGLANSVALDVVCSFLTDRAAASNPLKRVEKIEDMPRVLGLGGQRAVKTGCRVHVATPSVLVVGVRAWWDEHSERHSEDSACADGTKQHR